MSLRLTRIVALLIACVAAASSAGGEEPSGISVVGSGQVMVKPNLLEIELGASGSGELTTDAVTKYRDAVKNITNAFEQLKLKGLKIVPGAVGVQSAVPGNLPGMINVAAEEAPAIKSKVDVGRSLRLVLPEVDKLSEEELTTVIGGLLDTAKDSGAVVGPTGAMSMLARIYGQQANSSLVTFVVERADEARKQAYKDAFASARERAAHLAELADAELGRVLSVEEVAQGAASEEENNPMAFMLAASGLGSSNSSKRETRVVSDRMGEIPVRVTLKVRFALKERTGAK